jgi:hypothetical protein
VATSSTPGEQSPGVFHIGHHTGTWLRAMYQILDETALRGQSNLYATFLRWCRWGPTDDVTSRKVIA